MMEYPIIILIAAADKYKRLALYELKCTKEFADYRAIKKLSEMKVKWRIASAIGEQFAIVTYGNPTIVYDKATKVMYAASIDEHGCHTFTWLVNADGTPRIYEEEE